MTETRQGQILSLGLPITAAMLSQSLLTLVDTAMVAALDDASALAAVGLGGYASYFALALVLGLSVGVQTVVARCMGANDSETAFRALNSALLMAAIGGLILTAVCYFAAPLLMRLSEDAAVGVLAQEYFSWRSLGLIAIAVNFTYRGYWTGIRQVKVFLRMVVLVQLANFSFSYCLIFGAFGFPEMGAPGSGLGTTLSVVLGTIGYTLLTATSKHGELLFRALPERGISAEILRLSIPNGLQQVFIAAGMLVYFALLARISVAALAIGHAIINISLLIILPGNGLGMAATTLVSQALGRGEPEDAHRWGWDTVKLTALLMAVLGAPLWLFPEPILNLFLPANLIEPATLPLQITGFSAVLQAISMVLSQSLLGAGQARQVMVYSTALQWGLGLPLAALVGIYLGYGLIGVWCVQLVERVVAANLYTFLWQRRHWMNTATKVN